jgi:hypothetical protein
VNAVPAISLAAYAVRMEARRGQEGRGAAGAAEPSACASSPAMAAAIAALERTIPATLGRVRLHQKLRNRELTARRRLARPSASERAVEMAR